MVLDLEVQQYVAATNGSAPVRTLPVEEARREVLAWETSGDPGPEMDRQWDVQVPVSGGSIVLRVLVPRAHTGAVAVFLHGGGWVVGSVDGAEATGRRLAARSGAVVVLVGYRLAPEHRFPTPVDDAWEAVRWVARRRMELTGDPEAALAVVGESAGGAIAAAVARRARDADGPGVDLQVLICPVTDCDLETGSYRDPENQALMTRESMAWFWDQYVPDPAARRHPDASPLRIVELCGMPPAVVITAEHDVLRDEGELYAVRLLKAGVHVRHLRAAGQIHGFVGDPARFPAAERVLDEIAAALGGAATR
jgi:acetyl esterase